VYVTCEHVSDEVGLDVGSAVIAEESRNHQRRDAAEWQKQRKADAAEKREVGRHSDLQRFGKLHPPQNEHVQSYTFHRKLKHHIT